MTKTRQKEITKDTTLQRENADALLVVEETTPVEDLGRDVRLALHSAAEKKAFDLVALDLRGIADFADFFIIAGGANTRQVQAISDEITEQLKKQLESNVLRIEGYNTGEWILLDYGDFIVHIFEEKAREFYDLERLWRDAKRVELPEEIQTSGSIGSSESSESSGSSESSESVGTPDPTDPTDPTDQSERKSMNNGKTKEELLARKKEIQRQLEDVHEEERIELKEDMEQQAIQMEQHEVYVQMEKNLRKELLRIEDRLLEFENED